MWDSTFPMGKLSVTHQWNMSSHEGTWGNIEKTFNLPNMGTWVPMKGHVLEEHLTFPRRNVHSQCHIFLAFFNMGTHIPMKEHVIPMWYCSMFPNMGMRVPIKGHGFDVPQHGECTFL